MPGAGLPVGIASSTRQGGDAQEGPASGTEPELLPLLPPLDDPPEPLLDPLEEPPLPPLELDAPEEEEDVDPSPVPPSELDGDPPELLQLAMTIAAGGSSTSKPGAQSIDLTRAVASTARLWAHAGGASNAQCSL